MLVDWLAPLLEFTGIGLVPLLLLVLIIVIIIRG